MLPLIADKVYLVFDNCIKCKSVYYNVTIKSLINLGKYAKNENAKYFFIPYSAGFHVSIYSANDLNCVAILNPFDFDKEDNLTGDKTFNLIMEAIKKETRGIMRLYFSLTKDGVKTFIIREPLVKAKEDN